ncbi:50S ribosomal protein L13 [Candidatus Woesebacteria bacterium RIFCSPHIGHO2_01_FULL_44_10]|uniref:Large ribosomal subunit protein uL13 n=1 Tax=Candidatus Woesebacteria bacterium RIFCSPLOWO2_01_FULL_44_14 TaxID=1802525 RepID=A0A1F8C1I6_9BACT|nr:MAG: 50S ribosomal protein L13 [Candidatus Woesebacteria bacterium RIFCSPHIGHO2_01_FULL_44_10]OGM54727.1 MAG: 50S ribosomal protein L13 [Candidatus Woesebacteria bacterium RIFCSPHIGHO2_12_FULL_44_11]OGM70197.1 MAG: 50S ribosomal protein L13 [Candidatus Woesebacteria bacterium RIFCSPLOWO2_01_FULL_44_14]
MKTYQPKAKEIERERHLIDAKGKILGRLASTIAQLLMGKHKVKYAPHLDMGDFVVVTNAGSVKVTGKKEEKKVYYKHSGYPGGFKEVAYAKLKAEQPTKIIKLAVKRMLPDNKLRKNRMARLKFE